MKRIIAYFKDLLSTLHEIRDELRRLNHNCDRWFSTHDTFDYKRGSL